ncbi:MAG: hypothetical protein K1X61_10825 [Chitinophagales bacterium]|nr:hypothetical protein [Chitinophagales bacterium]
MNTPKINHHRSKVVHQRFVKVVALGRRVLLSHQKQPFSLMHYSDNDCHNGEICDQFKLLFNAFQMDFGEKIHAMWQSNSQGSLSLPNGKGENQNGAADGD